MEVKKETSSGEKSNVAVKKTARSKKDKDFYLTILRLLREGVQPSHLDENNKENGSIAAHLGISKQNLEYHLSKLKSLNYVRRIGTVWQVLIPEDGDISLPSKNKSSIGATGLGDTNLHAFNVEFPILDGQITSSDWEIKEKLNNWVPKYKGVNNLGGLTFKNNNNKSITVFCHARNIENLDEVYNLAFKLRAFVFEYFKNKEGVTLDVFNCKTKNLNLATQDKRLQGLIGKGEVFEVDLGRKAEQLYPADDRDAKAWGDNTPDPNSVETNDLAYKRAFLMQPIYVEKLATAFPAFTQALEKYAAQINLHLEVESRTNKLAEASLETQKKIQAFLEKLDKRLGEK